jgi:hypothetical protein
VGLRIGRSRLELKRHFARDRIRCIHRARRLEDLNLAPISHAIVRSIVDLAASSQETANGWCASDNEWSINRVDPDGSSLRGGFDSGRGSLWKPEWHGPCLLPRLLADLFLRANTARHLLVFLLVSEAIGSENYFKFNCLR